MEIGEVTHYLLTHISFEAKLLGTIKVPLGFRLFIFFLNAERRCILWQKLLCMTH